MHTEREETERKRAREKRRQVWENGEHKTDDRKCGEKRESWEESEWWYWGERSMSSTKATSQNNPKR